MIKLKNLKYFILPIGLILILSFSRLIPHPSNFTPILAVGVFAGFYFRNFILSLFIVIISMFIGDLVIGFHNTMIFTYSSLILAVAIGVLIKKFNFKEIIFSGLSSSVVFFIVTNFGSWLTLEMYEKNFSGLLQSYFMAVPFFHNTLISTLIYLIVLKLLLEFSIKKKLINISA
tara:strand:+ start:269 stop:790 length:522 start_codon:yes stop_codon:yes gene_type:complete